jgi:protein-S-isoprenylcysteine O-methyltransferase Ste14
LFISVVVLGFGFGIGVPYMYNWLDWAAPQDSINLGTTIVLVLVNIGCFISPTVINLIGSLVGNTSPRGIMILSAAAFAIIFVFALVHYLKVHKDQVNINKV